MTGAAVILIRLSLLSWLSLMRFLQISGTSHQVISIDTRVSEDAGPWQRTLGCEKNNLIKDQGVFKFPDHENITGYLPNLCCMGVMGAGDDRTNMIGTVMRLYM